MPLIGQNWLAFRARSRQIIGMSVPALEPKKLRPELIERIQAMDNESLVLLHRVLLFLEKEQLWRELSAEAEQDRRSGKFERLPEIIRSVRAEMRQG